jgi:hypothetical protein
MIRAVLGRHRGHEVKTTGDGFLGPLTPQEERSDAAYPCAQPLARPLIHE